jgi:hypothetical protein
MQWRLRSQRSRPRRLIPATVALACAVLVACTPADEAPEPGPPVARPQAGGTLTLGVVGEPPTLNPNAMHDPEPSRWLDRLDTWSRLSHTPGLEVVYQPQEESDALLNRLEVRFVQTLDTALELLEEGELDAAVLPSTVNLLERVKERGLNGGAIIQDEVVYLDLRGSSLDLPTRGALAMFADAPSLENAFVRTLGRPVNTLHPRAGERGTRGPFRDLVFAEVDGPALSLQLAVPIGDELLALMQRALHDDWEEHGFEVEVISIDARTFYGKWAKDPQVDVALRRGGGPGLPADRAAFSSLDAIPLFQVATVVAWRDGVHGIDLSDRRGPFATTERWWVDDG